MRFRGRHASELFFGLAKWAGAAFAIYFAVLVGLLLLGVAVHVSLLLLPILLVALPLAIYDLLFRAPQKGEPEAERHEE